MHSVTFQFNPDKLFDTIASVGDGGAALGPRLVEALLTSGNVDTIAGLGLAFYDVAVDKAPETFQARNAAWMAEAFAGDPSDLPERIARFGEEALELQQALGQSREDAHALVDYVFERPAGVPAQEMGGTMTTLALLAIAAGLDMVECGERELARCSTAAVLAKIRGKRANRAGRGPLPGIEANNVTPLGRAPLVVSVSDHDGSPLLSYPIVPDEAGALVLMPGFVTGAPDRNRLRAALRQALAFLGPDESTPSNIDDIFGDGPDSPPDLASVIAAEVMGLQWTHAPAVGADDGDGEHMNRYGDVQGAAAEAIARLRREYPAHDFMPAADEVDTYPAGEGDPIELHRLAELKSSVEVPIVSSPVR